MPISSQQSRGARGLLNWKLSDLAAASAIGLSTLKHFEHARRRTTLENLVAIRDAFEKAGIIFESDGKFIGVRLKIKHAAKAAAKKRGSDTKFTPEWSEQMTGGNQDF
jgi:histidinol-phosphate/aromatic aminotransferase/cobyric acid decarboxylase-like protein